MSDIYKEMERGALDEDEEDDKRVTHRTINCMSKEPNCHTPECIKHIECGGEGSPGHCYAIITPDYSITASGSTSSSGGGDATADSQFSVADLRSNVSHSHIVQAGCTVGGMECESFATIRAYVEEKFADAPNVLKDINARYQPPAVLLDPKVSGKCVAYSENQNRINGQLFCCCASDNCNQQIYLIQETNPYIKLMSELNTVERKPKPASSTIKLPSHTTSSTNAALMTTGQLYMLVISLLALLVFVLIGILFIMRHRSRRKPGQHQQQHANVYYSQSNSSGLLNNVNNLAHPSQHEFNRIMSNNSAAAGATGLASNRNQLFTNEEYMSLTQPLLMHQNATFASSMVAPNITVLPSNLFNTTNHVGGGGGTGSITAMSSNNKGAATLSNHHFTIDYSNQVNNVVLNDHMMPITRLRSLDNDDEIFEALPEQLPRNLKASDLYLIEKIAHGQFSSVWKARCKQQEEEVTATTTTPPEYAVKIFASNQKSAWSNEKEIYNTLASTNPNILRYYASDIFELPVSENNNNSDIVSTASSLNYEYWILTEYHPVGSLYDFLKLQHLSWPQMVRLLVCILDGLAYLHSENLEINKNYAIAHRDLKSKNILVKSDGQSCCIGDFGLALKVTNNIYKLQSAEIRSKVGTRRYMSPELIEGAIAFTKETFLRIDVYACSLVMWEILSRGDFYENPCEYRLPFEEEVGQNPSLEDMKDIVVEKNMRPIIKSEWLKHHQVGFIAQTIEECWDIDLDARISSELASSRVRKIYQTI